MKKLGLTVLGIFAAASLATSVWAEKGGANPGKRFKEADTNGDEKLSREEFKADIEKNIEQRFANADADGDGFLTREEMKAAHGKRPDHPNDASAN